MRREPPSRPAIASPTVDRTRWFDQRVGAEMKCVVLATDRNEVTPPLTAPSIAFCRSMREGFPKHRPKPLYFRAPFPSLGSASLPQRTASKRAPAPRNGRPNALMQVVPGDFGDDFEAGNRARDLDPSRKQPTDRKCVERPQCPPTDGLQDRSCVCFCSAERYHRVRLPAGRGENVSRWALRPTRRISWNSPWTACSITGILLAIMQKTL